MFIENYFEDKASAVRSVNALLQNLEPTSALIMTIRPGKSGGYFVISATAELSEGTETQMSLKQPTNIS